MDEQDVSHPLISVGVSIIPPMVMRKGEGFDGFEIALWESVAREIGAQSHFSVVPFQDLLQSLKDKKITVAIASLTMTEEREKLIDFTHVTFNSGLHILVANKAKIRLFSLLHTIFNKEVGKVLLILLGFLILSAHLIWFTERNGGGSLAGSYFPEIFNALWWALVTVASVGYGDYVPITAMGRIVGAFTILSGLVIIGFYIAQISTALTLKSLHSDITHHDDLRGKRVGTVAGSHAQLVLKKYGPRIVPVQDLADAYTMLMEGSIDAVVFDAPTLSHYADNEGRGKGIIVGGVFERQDYAFALQDGSSLRERINQALLKLRESGEYARIYKEWFGNE